MSWWLRHGVIGKVGVKKNPGGWRVEWQSRRGWYRSWYFRTYEEALRFIGGKWAHP